VKTIRRQGKNVFNKNDSKKPQWEYAPVTSLHMLEFASK